MSQPAREPTIIERLLTAMVEGKPEAVLQLIHPEGEWSPTVWSGHEVYYGREGVSEWLAQFGEALEHLDIRVEKVVAEGNRGVVLGTVFDSRDESMFAVRVAWSFEVVDGLIRRGRAHENWEEAVQAAGLSHGAS